MNERLELDTQPIICLLEQRPENYQRMRDLPDGAPDLVIGISKSEIAREAVELFLELRRPRDVLRTLGQKYGVRRKGYVAKVSGKYRGVEILLAAEKTSTQTPEKRKRELKKVDLTTSAELLFWRQSSSFSVWLQNPVLRGHTAYQKYDSKTKRRLPPECWEVHLDTHADQRLLTDAEYAEILAILAENHRQIGTPHKTYYLTRLVSCDVCGHKMVLKSGPQYRYYGCRHGATDCGNRKCIRTEKLEEAIISAIFEKVQVANQNSSVVVNNPEQSPEVQRLKEQISDMERMLDKGFVA